MSDKLNTVEDLRSDDEVLAEFIGFMLVSENPVIKGVVCHGRTWKAPVEKDLPYWGGFRTEQLHKFQTSWDWLMPVCLKWDSLSLNQFNEQTRPKYLQLCDDLDHFVSCYEIEPAYRQLVKNIRWYTTNNTQQK